MTVNSVASKNAIAVRTSSSGAGLTIRRSDVRQRSGDLLAQPPPDLAILRRREPRVVEPGEEDGAAAEARRASSGGVPRSDAR